MGPHYRLQYAKHKLKMLLSGYQLGDGIAEAMVKDIMSALRDPALPLTQFLEYLSNLSGRIPETLFESFMSITSNYAKSISTNRFYWERIRSFPVMELQDAIDNDCFNMSEKEKEKMMTTLEAGHIITLLDSFSGGNHTYASKVIRELLDDFFEIEDHFKGAKTPEFVIKRLRQLHLGQLDTVARVARSHYQLNARCKLIELLLNVLEKDLSPLLSEFIPILK